MNPGLRRRRRLLVRWHAGLVTVKSHCPVDGGCLTSGGQRARVLARAHHAVITPNALRLAFAEANRLHITRTEKRHQKVPHCNVRKGRTSIAEPQDGIRTERTKKGLGHMLSYQEIISFAIHIPLLIAEARLLLHVSKPDSFSPVNSPVLRSSSAIT